MNKITNYLIFQIQFIYNLVHNYLLFNNTKKVKIETLLSIKQNIEESINKDYDMLDDIISSKKKNKEHLFDNLLNQINKKTTQLNYFKLAQQEANMKKHKDGKSNFYYIFELSNLNKARDYLVKVKKRISSKKLSKDNFEEPNAYLKKVMDKIENITTKLSEFNKNTFIKVRIIPELNVL